MNDSLSFPPWEDMRTWSTRARLLAYELLRAPLCSQQSIPGLWLQLAHDAAHWIDLPDASALRSWLAGSELAAWVVMGQGDELWCAPRMAAQMQQRPQASRLQAMKRDLQALDEALKRRISEDVLRLLQRCGRSQSLQALWAGAARARARVAAPDCAWVVDLYHEMLPQLPRVISMTPQRQQLVQARLRDLTTQPWSGQHPDERKALQAYFARVAQSDFLCGRSEAGFRADLEWLMRPSNCLKVIEGRYDNKPAAPTAFSAAFLRFWAAYPVQDELFRAWRVWSQMGLDALIDDILVCLQDDKLRYRRLHQMPPAWRYLQGRPWQTPVLIDATRDATGH
ncbi:MAG: hypothetical protein N2690_00100 [Rhodocyclaceae bacterium]|nr:hypothetical protein [Rhodocyclaceae bacterium]